MCFTYDKYIKYDKMLLYMCNNISLCILILLILIHNQSKFSKDWKRYLVWYIMPK